MPTGPIPSGFQPTVSTTRGGGDFEQRGGSRTQFWGPSKRLAKDVMGFAQEQFETPISYFPGQTEAPTSPYFQAGLWQLAGRAYEGSPVQAPGEEFGAATLRGDYLAGGNPYLDDYFNRAARGVTSNYMNTIAPNLESRFAGAGRTGGGAYQAARGQAQEGLATSLGDLASQVYTGAYESERGRQMQALAMVPMLQASRYTDANELMRAGALQQGDQQRFIDAARARHQFGQMEPWQRAGLAAGLYGQSPVAAGTDFWQSGTSSEEGKQVTIAPEAPEQSGGGMGSFWMQMLMSII